jgi:hypothetical protein
MKIYLKKVPWGNIIGKICHSINNEKCYFYDNDIICGEAKDSKYPCGSKHGEDPIIYIQVPPPTKNKS